MSGEDQDVPLLRDKYYNAPPAFTPDSLLREARRQKSLDNGLVPEICILDPDGDIVRFLIAKQRAQRNLSWACYHTTLYNFDHDGITFGIIGCAVGGSFAVLLAEQLFASGCKLLISITSAGQVFPIRQPPYFVLIDRALRDEGTSLHYMPPSEYVHVRDELEGLAQAIQKDCPFQVERGASWTTDAPYRETESAIEQNRNAGILAVEMETASLYAFARAKQKPVLCFAHITNQMGTTGDFEKGEANGSLAALDLIGIVAKCWQRGMKQ